MEHSELRSMQALFESRYKTESLRSFEAKGELDFSELKVNWEHPVRDTLEGHIETTALTINLKDFRLPTSQTFDRADVERFRGLVSVPRLYHYKDLRSGKEYFAVVIIQPTKDWLEAHGIEEVYRSVRVPATFEGQLDVYSVDKKPLLRYVYREGRGISYYIFSKQDKGRAFRVECQWVSAGVSYQQSGRIEGGDYVIILTKVDQWEYQCRDVPDEEWWKRINNGVEGIPSPIGPIVHFIPEDSVGGVSMYDQSPKLTRAEELQQKIFQDCLDFKKILDENSELSKKVAEINNYRVGTDPLRLKEMGYAETSEGEFLKLKPKGSHRLDFKSLLAGVEVKGVIHNHTKNRDIVNPSAGDTLKERPIQIFSDLDLAHFFKIVGRSLRSNVISSSDVYHILVTEKYAYRLKMHGEKEEVISKMAGLTDGYNAVRKEIQHTLGVREVRDPMVYPGIDTIYHSFISILEKHQQFDGLVIQRINLETKEVNTTALCTSEKSQLNKTHIEKLISDC